MLYRVARETSSEALEADALHFAADECGDGHGYWLDAGEEGRVRDIVNERVRGLERSATAEAAWGRFLGGLKGGRGGGLFGRRGR